MEDTFNRLLDAARRCGDKAAAAEAGAAKRAAELAAAAAERAAQVAEVAATSAVVAAATALRARARERAQARAVKDEMIDLTADAALESAKVAGSAKVAAATKEAAVSRGARLAAEERAKKANATAKEAIAVAQSAAETEAQEHGLSLSLGRTLRELIEGERAAAAGEVKGNHGIAAIGGTDSHAGVAGLGDEGMRILRWHVANIEYSTGVREKSRVVLVQEGGGVVCTSFCCGCDRCCVIFFVWDCLQNTRAVPTLFLGCVVVAGKPS